MTKAEIERKIGELSYLKLENEELKEYNKEIEQKYIDANEELQKLKNKKYIMYITCDGECHTCEHYKNGHLLELMHEENKKKEKRLKRQFKLFAKKDKEIEQLKKDNAYQWEQRCKLTFELEELQARYDSLTADEIDSKEVSDALHMLLHCALKDKEFDTQKEQFQLINSYIKHLEDKTK